MCEMSGYNQIVTKRHAMHEHISGIFHESQPLTEDVLTLRKTCLTICVKQVNHRPDIEALVRLVNLCGEVESAELTSPRHLAPSPKHFGSLVFILSLDGVEVTCRLLGEFWKVFEKDLPEYVDSHFYMDMLSKKTGLEVTAFKKTLEKT